jgi:hypothetical protein
VATLEIIGYDPCSHLSVRFRSGIEVLGCIDKPEDAVIADDMSSLTASYYLSGFTKPAVNIWSDSKHETKTMLSYWKDGRIINKRIPSTMFGLVPFCVGGRITRKPDEIAELCSSYPSSSFFVSPIVDESSAIGAAVVSQRPTREFVAKPFTEELPLESMEYWDDSMDGDRCGKMARHLALGGDIYNDAYIGCGKTRFYGTEISGELKKNDVVMVRSNMVNEYFPDTPISAKVYAATSVPVRMKTSDKFRKDVGYEGKEVNVLVASDHIPWSSTFLNYYKMASGKNWVSLSSMINDRELPIFRYNRVYRKLKGDGNG